jgi:hypothetical protein
MSIDLTPKTINKLFLQQIQALSTQSYLRDAINLKIERGEI